MDWILKTATWKVFACMNLLLSMSSAATITPTNTTDFPNYGSDLEIGLKSDEAGTVQAVFPVIPLTSDAGSDIPNQGLTGSIVLADATNLLGTRPVNIALISCDPYSGNLQPTDVFGLAADNNASAVVFYSEEAESCQASNLGQYRWVYALKSRNQTEEMLQVLNSLDDRSRSQVFAIVARQDTGAIGNGTSGSSSGSSSDNNQQQSNPLEPSPSTAVAMIILYSITGIITALFLVIIITGAVRAHRHPERYGPRNGIGRPRQTRARGIARAMLDSIPIVKFGDREDQPPKPTEVELENGQPGQHGQVESLGEQNRTPETVQKDESAETAAQDGTTRSATTQAVDGTDENGIAAAIPTERRDSVPKEENQGCSICTEDFEVGQDQRVLPCNHRFHPACIDPWLLNVSGTCPLCRIDLRPAEAEDEEVQTDEHGNPIRPEGGLAPPLEGDGSRRASYRRSIMLSLMGIPRPYDMTREERLRALREYRLRSQQRVAVAENERPGGASESAEAAQVVPVEDESRRRRRFRNAFRIRTRRAGEDERIAEEVEQNTAAQSAEEVSTAQAPASNSHATSHR